MRVVSNISPLSNLAVIGRLDLLQERYREVFIPLAVWQDSQCPTMTLTKNRLRATLWPDHVRPYTTGIHFRDVR